MYGLPAILVTELTLVRDHPQKPNTYSFYWNNYHELIFPTSLLGLRNRWFTRLVYLSKHVAGPEERIDKKISVGLYVFFAIKGHCKSLGGTDRMNLYLLHGRDDHSLYDLLIGIFQ